MNECCNTSFRDSLVATAQCFGHITAATFIRLTPFHGLCGGHIGAVLSADCVSNGCRLMAVVSRFFYDLHYFVDDFYKEHRELISALYYIDNT